MGTFVRQRLPCVCSDWGRIYNFITPPPLLNGGGARVCARTTDVCERVGARPKRDDHPCATPFS